MDRGVARGEAALAAAVLLSMVLIAAGQALVRNLTHFEWTWANEVLERMAWADSLLQKATLWLAFLGASLATHEGRHIGIDVLPRVAPPRLRAWMEAVVGVGCAVICFFLARVFWMAVLNNAVDVPLEYSVLGPDGGALHVCESRGDRPMVFCMARGALRWIGATVSTPDDALQLVAPAMFGVMAIRFVLRACCALVSRGSRPNESKPGAAPQERA